MEMDLKKNKKNIRIKVFKESLTFALELFESHDKPFEVTFLLKIKEDEDYYLEYKAEYDVKTRTYSCDVNLKA